MKVGKEGCNLVTRCNTYHTHYHQQDNEGHNDEHHMHTRNEIWTATLRQFVQSQSSEDKHVRCVYHVS